MSTIGIAGGGIGGLSAAIALRKVGHDVVVFEQAARFGRVGADINLTPNAVRALDGLGVGDALRATAARPQFRISRMWDTGAETSRLPMSDEAERQYGAPQLTLHRADLLSALENALPAECIRLGHKAEAIEQDAIGVTIRFTNGEAARVDALVGADGIHSVVRAALHGAESPRFTGVVAFRAVVRREKVAGVPNLDSFTKWWGPNPQSQIVTFPLNLGRDICIFATIGQDSWTHESWTQPGSVEELRSLYADFHPEARALLDACDEVLKTALWERDPLPFWSKGRVTLLGDAAHPMLPFMAQGACQAAEDAVVLARCVAESRDIESAFAAYAAARQDRTARIQLGSRANNWLREGGNADWVYGYDSWAVKVVEHA
jgi:salicylate hydroxylase